MNTTRAFIGSLLLWGYFAPLVYFQAQPTSGARCGLVFSTLLVLVAAALYVFPRTPPAAY